MSVITISDLAAPPVARSAPLTSQLLADIAAGLAASDELWRPHAHHDPTCRRPVRLVVSDLWEAWVVGWTPGQHVDVHDHGDSAGVLVVVEGDLVEVLPAGPDRRLRTWQTGDVVDLPVGVVHDVVGLGPGSVDEHPRLLPAARDDHLLRGRSSRPGRGDRRRAGDHRPAKRLARPPPEPASWVRAPSTGSWPRPAPASIGCSPTTSRRAQAAGALVVDIRPDAYRLEEGDLPGAVVVDRNHLEWWLDPTSDAAIAEVTPGQRVIIACNEGYASSLAAATLRDLGVDATDLVGGYRAWFARARPSPPPPDRRPPP